MNIFFRTCVLLFLYSASLSSMIVDQTTDLSQFTGKKIGYFLGSFDPVHLGHQEVIDLSLSCGHIDYILVYPAPGSDQFKKRSSAQFRGELISLEYKDHPNVLLTEMTPSELQTEFFQQLRGAEVIGIVGMDVIKNRLLSADQRLAKKYDEIFMRGVPIPPKHHESTIGALMAPCVDTFIVAYREMEDIDQFNQHRVNDRKIVTIIPTKNEASSTAIRSGLRNRDRLITNQVSPRIAGKIKEKQAYTYDRILEAQIELLNEIKQAENLFLSIRDEYGSFDERWEHFLKLFLSISGDVIVSYGYLPNQKGADAFLINSVKIAQKDSAFARVHSEMWKFLFATTFNIYKSIDLSENEMVAKLRHFVEEEANCGPKTNDGKLEELLKKMKRDMMQPHGFTCEKEILSAIRGMMVHSDNVKIGTALIDLFEE